MASKKRKKLKPNAHRARIFQDDSPFILVQKEADQAPDRRRGLINQLEESLGARVITFFGSFISPFGQIADADAEIVESILAVEHDTPGKIVLILSSAGGQALAAERIVNVCRAYSNNQFEVVVPHAAKSAATMICFGATKIHMSRTAELGPVDPQVRLGENHWISAEEYIRSYDGLMTAASSGKFARIEPHLQQLARYDARQVEQFRSATKLSEEISVRLLKASMMKGKADDTIKKNIGLFLSQEQTRAHGRMIGVDEAKACGLNINLIDLHSPLWETLWELYTRSSWVVNNRCAKIVESCVSAVKAGPSP